MEVRNGAARFNVAVRTESIQRATSLVRARGLHGDATVKLPMETESFFVNDPVALVEIADLKQPDRIAA